jgi:copper chaperone
MIAFRVDDMSCSHCAQTITRAINAVDGRSKVDIDVDRKLVRIEADSASTERMRAAIAGAGFTPVALGTT